MAETGGIVHTRTSAGLRDPAVSVQSLLFSVTRVSSTQLKIHSNSPVSKFGRSHLRSVKAGPTGHGLRSCAENVLILRFRYSRTHPSTHRNRTVSLGSLGSWALVERPRGVRRRGNSSETVNALTVLGASHSVQP